MGPDGRGAVLAELRVATVEAVAAFAAVYAASVLDYVRSLPDSVLDPAVDALVGAVVADGNTLYLLGNGGSHAIARHLELSLRRRLADVHALRISCAVDYHVSQSLAVASGFESIFEALLRSEGARAGDLAILISGSGDSDNLVRAAAYCRAHGVRSVSFAGFDGGRISRPGVTDLPFVVRVHDQQISEDIVQVLLHAAVEQTHRRTTGAAGPGPVVRGYASRLAATLERLEPAFLERLSRDVCSAFLAGQAVYLLAPREPRSACRPSTPRTTSTGTPSSRSPTRPTAACTPRPLPATTGGSGTTAWRRGSSAVSSWTWPSPATCSSCTRPTSIPRRWAGCWSGPAAPR